MIVWVVPAGTRTSPAGAGLAPMLTNDDAARLVPVAAPSTGVTSVGVFANTSAPVPVSSDTSVARFALLGVPRNVCAFAESAVLLSAMAAPAATSASVTCTEAASMTPPVTLYR